MDTLSQCTPKMVFKLEAPRADPFTRLNQLLIDTPPGNHKYPLFCCFENECGVDTGGVKHEMLTILADQLFKESSKMFIQAGYNTLLISPECPLDHAYTIGWVIGKSVFHQVSLPLQVSKLLL